MVLTSEETTLRKTIWDREHDLYILLQNKNKVLKTEIDKFNYFNTLLQSFLLKDPKADSELLQFTHSSSSILHSYVLHLQDQITKVDSQSETVIVDPQYEYFMKHLKPHGKSYVLDIVEDSHSAFVKYENEESSCAKYKGKLRVRKSKGAKLSTERSPNVSSTSNIVASESRKCSRGRKLKGAKFTAVKRRHEVDGKFVVSKAPNQRRKRRKMNPKGISVSKAACFEHTEGQNIGHGGKGEQFDAPFGVETRVKEEIEDEDADDDALDIKRPAKSPVLKIEHFWCRNEAIARKDTDFKAKLMNELKRPYCEEEHKRLLQEFTVRKPVQHHKDLRNGVSKTYEIGDLGKSFHDHNIDLAVKIDSAHNDHPKCLNLLRGFFFWLRNLTHEGAFMPWRLKDPLSLDVLPQQ